jgi:hypothetical protein
VIYPPHIRHNKNTGANNLQFLNIVKVTDENGDLLADSHILNRCKNFSELLTVHRISDVRQIEIYTAELLGSDPSPFEVETAITKLKMYKSPGSE